MKELQFCEEEESHKTEYWLHLQDENQKAL